MGRPPKYKTPEEMEAVINKYFEDCDRGRETVCTDKAGRPLTDKEGKVLTYMRPLPYTMEGLDLALDFLSREARSRYKKKSTEFRDVITRARKKVINNLVTRGALGELNQQVVGLIIRTHGGYTDKQKVDVSGSVEISINDTFTGKETKPKPVKSLKKA